MTGLFFTAQLAAINIAVHFSHTAYGHGIFTAAAYPSLFATRSVPKDSPPHVFASVKLKDVVVVLYETSSR